MMMITSHIITDHFTRSSQTEQIQAAGAAAGAVQYRDIDVHAMEDNNATRSAL